MTWDDWTGYYRRDGTPYPDGEAGLVQWHEDHRNPELRIVKQETLPNGYWVSTVWIGLNHNFGDGPPLIFETMVFHKDSGMTEDYCERYATENDAILGHMVAVDLYQAMVPPLDPRTP